MCMSAKVLIGFAPPILVMKKIVSLSALMANVLILLMMQLTISISFIVGLIRRFGLSVLIIMAMYRVCVQRYKQAALMLIIFLRNSCNLSHYIEAKSKCKCQPEVGSL